MNGEEEAEYNFSDYEDEKENYTSFSDHRPRM